LGSIPLASFAVTQGGVDIPIKAGATVGTMRSFVANDVDAPMGDLKIKIQDTETVIDKMWLVDRYVLA
jgi:hypothetical protein